LWLKNKSFEWFGDIDVKTPMYSNYPKMLFFDEEIRFNENKNKFESIDEISSNISLEAELIKDKYNLDLVYLVIPNKFSIYSDLIVGDPGYDNYIPILQEKLKSKGVKYIDIYSVFYTYRKNNPTELIYYSGDTHYNARGKKLLIDVLMNLKSDK